MKERKTVCVLVIALLLCIVVYRQREPLLGILAVFAFAGVFTLLLAPICRRFEQYGFHASLASGAAVGLFMLLVLAAVFSFIPYLVSHSIDLIRRSAPTLSSIAQRTGEWFSQTGIQGFRQIGAVDAVASIAAALTSLAAKGSMSFAAQTGRIAFSLVLTYYMLRERSRIGGHLLLCVPVSLRTSVLFTLRGCRNAVMGYLAGMLKTSAFVGAATYMGLLLLGVQDAFLLALFMGAFEVLPYIGPVLAAIPILISSLSQGIDQAVLSLVLVILVQQLEGSFISPYFTASSTSLHPLAALLSVFVLGSLLGVWGILLGVPLVITIRSILWSSRIYMSDMRGKKIYTAND